MAARKKSEFAQQQNHYKIGMLVYAKRIKQKAVIRQALSLEIYQIEILANGLKLRESIDYLEPLAQTVTNSETIYKKSGYHELSSGSAELDLHGMRYEPAIERLAQFVDQAIINDYSYIRVNHGKGSGALQMGVWQFLRSHSQVKQFQFAPQNLGGRGVTIVEFK
ncbi:MULTISPECIES: Smr/MutS family protein [unclassified Enterococcus]|uniref:Smr/MutS family protein n=1 Tax=unclassified Enterococcus TaxID=2608891 RepID=UPI0015578E17|nr:MULTISPECIES: Smr/MutS family protein [unclassified Enterococcus]MBS7577642.1 Smr/MutS family protein [Enterococcus sp. MMGLQ5-2]MBS7584164.1 Smr/MutS family protein [Enterococcus sp. MMGLQ5-1]NPD12022.1 hypothetical protein [Enterococcus sp. MMGLQ5-1]NPD37475.1 hypothetical protein [Enterococcus sp. MMGLQ5-2]